MQGLTVSADFCERIVCCQSEQVQRHKECSVENKVVHEVDPKRQVLPDGVQVTADYWSLQEFSSLVVHLWGT